MTVKATPESTDSLDLFETRDAKRRPAHTTTLAYVFLVLGLVGTTALFTASVITFVLSVVGVLVASWITHRHLTEAGSGVVIAVTGWLLRADLSGLPLTYRIVGLAAVAISLVPLATWRRVPDRFPILGIFLAIQAVYIYVGALVAQPSLPYQVTYTLHVREVGIVATLVYVAILVAAWMVVSRFPVILPGITRWTSRIPTAGSTTVAFRRAVLLIATGIVAARFVPAGIVSHLGYIPVFIGLARIAGVAVMVVLWVQGRLGMSQKLITVAAVLADAVAGTSGQLTLYSAAGCAITALVVVAVSRRQMAILLIIVIVPLALVLNVAKTEARASEPAGINHITAVTTLLHDAETTTLHPDRSSWTTSAERFDYPVELLGYVVVHVPRDYPYWNKQTYTLLPYTLIPRVLVPFKPVDTLSNQFGREYGLISPYDFGTSVNTPIQVEAWANFGAPGLIGIAVLVGALLAMVEGWFNPRRIDGLILGVVVTFQVSSGIESGINTFAVVLPIVLLYGPVLWWALAPNRRDSGTAPIDHMSRGKHG